MKLPPKPSSNRLVASLFVAGLILWGAGMIALFFYVQAETSRSNARKELGRELISTKPNSDGCELDKCEVVGGELVVSGRDPSTLLDLVEEPLD